jgi:hypothetical protein
MMDRHDRALVVCLTHRRAVRIKQLINLALRSALGCLEPSFGFLAAAIIAKPGPVWGMPDDLLPHWPRLSADLTDCN